MRNWIKTILILAVAIMMAMPCTAQGDGGGKKKKKPVKTEQTQSSASKHKQREEARRKREEEAKRKQEAEAKRKREAEAKRQQEEEAQRQRQEAKLQKDAVIQNLIDNMVYVEGGSYMMGGVDSEAYNVEKPVHEETVGSFSIGKYEVTQKEWKAVMGTNPSKFKGDDLPVEMVSWDDCQEFIKNLNAMTGKNFRLPTEVEWEYAARGGNRNQSYKYSGSNNINNVAWYDGNSGNKTHNVGTKAPNEPGIYDMSGNVWEWTSSNWCDDYSRPRDSSNFVCRGGSWRRNAPGCRVSYRLSSDSTSRSSGLGLRLAL